MKSPLLKVGDRVRIACDEDKALYGKIGTVIVIEEDAPHALSHYYGRSIFVQMVRNKGGLWWYPCFLTLLPPLRKQATKPKMLKNNR